MQAILEFINFNQYNLPTLAFGFLAMAMLVWLTVSVWVLRDITTRTHSLLTRISAFLLVLVGNIPGLLVYVLLRPSQSLQEASNRELFYASIIDNGLTTCAHCHSLVRKEYKHCPQCGEITNPVCPQCTQQINPDWPYCVHCGLDLHPSLEWRQQVADRLEKVGVVVLRLTGVVFNLPTTIWQLVKHVAKNARDSLVGVFARFSFSKFPKLPRPVKFDTNHIAKLPSPHGKKSKKRKKRK